MTQYNTKNPVGSASPKDVNDNAITLDNLVNSMDITTKDRLGNDRLTIKGLEEAAISSGPTVEAAAKALEQANLAREAAQNIEVNSSEFVLQAESSAKSAQQSEANSEQSAIRAESAASSAAIEAKVFANISEGIAGTVSGEMFKVWSNPNTGISFLFYKNNNGTAELLTNYPSASAVEITETKIDNLSALFSHPNFWFDDDLSILSKKTDTLDKAGMSYAFSNINIKRNDNSANPSLLITSLTDSVCSFSVNISLQVLKDNGISAGDLLTFGIRFIDSSGGLKTGNDRVVVQQYNAAGVEFTDARVTIQHPEARTPFSAMDIFQSTIIQEGCHRVRIYFSVSSKSNSVEVGRFLFAKGHVNEYRPPYMRAISNHASNGATSYQSAFVSMVGSDDSGDGTTDKPYKTINKAINALGGMGKVYISGGGRYGEQIDASKITDIELIGSDDATHNRTEFYYGQKLSGITKTEGKNKTYQCALDIASQPNFIWLDNIADTETKILPEYRHPLSRGREYRLWCTKIYATKAQQSTNAALNEIENTRIPLCYYSPSEKVMYFSLPENINPSMANVYVAMNNNLGLFSNKSSIWTPKGLIKLTNIHVRYGGIDTRGFVKAEQLNCSSIGAPANAFDVSWHDDLNLCEAAGAGSSNIVNGDGFNATQKADWMHSNCYAHDCNDDGFSSHQNCVEVGNNPIAEFNGGAGLCPSYGAQATYNNPITICNSVNSRVAIEKRGGITCIQSPRDEDNGVLTDCTVYNGLSIGDKNSFWDDGLDYGKQAQLTTYNCISINPVEYGFANLRAINCKHGGRGTAKKEGVTSVQLTDI